MRPVVIEDPILNSPFTEPTRHFKFDDDGITNERAEFRRRSTYFMPIPKPRTRGGSQLGLAGDFATEQARDNDFINRVREHVAAWRTTDYPGITAVTRELLAYWQEPSREKPLFFCQIEALETAIFLAEVAGHRQPWIENRLREDSDARNPGLYRIAFKMATGSGKTVGLDFYDPTTGVVRSDSTDDIACWFIETAYDDQQYFVRHAYFLGADDPYDKLKRALRADIDEAAWASLNSTVSRPFPRPASGRIAVKVINHYGDEILKVYAV